MDAQNTESLQNHTNTLPSNPTLTNQKSILPFILLVLGIIEAILPIFLLTSIVPQLIRLYSEVNSKEFNALATYIVLGSIILIATVEVMYAGLLLHKQKKIPLSSASRRIAIVLLIVGLIAFVATIPYTITAVITPIYRLTSEF